MEAQIFFRASFKCGLVGHDFARHRFFRFSNHSSHVVRVRLVPGGQKDEGKHFLAILAGCNSPGHRGNCTVCERVDFR